MNAQNWVIFKFGGSVLRSVERIQQITEWVPKRTSDRTVIVVSAMEGITDRLLEVIELAKNRNESYKDKLQLILNHQLGIIDDLLQSLKERKALQETICKDCKDIFDLLHATFLSQTCSDQVRELICGYGELWSAQIFAGMFAAKQFDVLYLDARQVLVVEQGEIGPNIQWELSKQNLESKLTSFRGQLIVVTGFIASTVQGIPTTLGRNGSDFSASIFGVLLNAKEITFWKDVDGVLSADPKRVPDARVLNELSYHEASELAYFGAKVIHPRTLAPAIRSEIPIRIRNAFHPDRTGTLIHKSSLSSDPVKGFSTVEDVALVNLEGTGILGVPGVANRLFGALKAVGISVIMISQASSEHSICFVIPKQQAGEAVKAVKDVFYLEILKGSIQTIDVDDHCCVLAAVGDNMAFQPGIAGRFFSSLGEARINIRAIAQGSSERNISIVISQEDATRALRVVHSTFYLSRQTLSMGLIGPGLIGSTLLEQLSDQKHFLQESLGVDFRLRAIANSRKMLLTEQSINLQTWKSQLESEGVPFDMEAFISHLRSDSIPHSVMVDCTASSVVSEFYPEVLSRGIHIVTPNKRANSGPLPLYQAIQNCTKKNQVHYLYEATVGAGLPLVNTLKELILTGDKLLKIEGILSGTLSYLFNSYDGEKAFSQLVFEARSKGYTEPDPREDLSGLDVARKLVILAREAQIEIELNDVKIESLIPLELRNVDYEQFVDKFPLYDQAMKERYLEARKKGQVLRYIGRVDKEKGAEVSLRSVPEQDIYSSIVGTDNLIAFSTQRYLAQPLIVQGPGAGPDVTAGGVFADLLRLAYYLGASIR